MRTERYGDRDLAFSRWHRGLERDDLTWIDIDHCAYCDDCKVPLYLMELARDVGQPHKATTITRSVANRLGVPALLVFYSTEDELVSGFRVQRVAPAFTPLVSVTPAALAEWIEKQHDTHVCASQQRAAA